MPRKKTKPVHHTPFSQKLLDLRQHQGLERDELSQRVQVSTTYIALLESGERQPSREVVSKLAQALAQDNAAVEDELLLLAGFKPNNLDSLAGPKDLIAIYERALADNERDFKTFTALIRELIKAGLYAKATAKIQLGFQLFQEAIQLQCLASHLELAKGNYDGAILTQQMAIEHFLRQAPHPDWPVAEADLLFNLGALYFLKGYDSLGRQIAAGNERDMARETQLRSAAEDNFRLARETLRQAMELAPDDIYVLDEYARVCFNQAYLADTAAAGSLWQETIASFKAVLYAGNKHSLGRNRLMEASAFLGHAYSKAGLFEEAEYTLQLTDAFCAQDWLVHYIRACYHSLRYEKAHDPQDLDRALRCLAAASAGGACRGEALRDPDLQAVRTLRKTQFMQIIESED